MGVKVLVISAAFPPMPTGDAAHALYLCQHLAQRGVNVQVLTTVGNNGGSRLPFRVFPIMRNWSWSQLPRLAMFVKRCAPDAVILVYVGWVYQEHPMMTFAPTVCKRLLRGVPFVTQFEWPRGALPHQMSRWSQAVRKRFVRWAGSENVDYYYGTLLRDSDRLIVLSDQHRATLAERFAGVNQKSVLIPPPPIMRMSSDNGLSRQRGREKLGVKPDEHLLVYYGYVYPGKGIDTLLRAFQLLSERRNGLRLVMAGGILESGSPERAAYAQEIRELPKRLGIEDKVFWTGELAPDTEDASVYLHAADVCVLPFDAGVFLNNSSFAAAAAHGLPIVTTRGDVLEPQFVDGENVLLCPPQNPEAMAEAVAAVVERPDLRRQIQAGASQLAQEWFSWDSAIERTLAALRANP
jgi:glycosyltransferase involved in cell wall biosynthesis